MSLLLTDKQVRDLIKTEIKLAEEFNELLNALEDLLQLAQDCDEGQYMDYPGSCIIFDNAREVISKAKGEQV